MDKILNVNLETQTAPQVRETIAKDWIQYGTEDNINLYPQFLIDLFYNSSTHAAIINATSAMIAGEDIIVEHENEDDKQVYYANQFLTNPNSKETMHELLKKVAFDFKLQGGFALNIVWSQDRTRIAEIYHIPVERLRAAKPDARGVVTEYYICADWADTRRNEPQAIPAFNINDRTSPSQILYTGRYSPEMDVYFVPDYVGGCNWALIDQHIAEFHLNNIQNGFAGSYFISFSNGVPTQEERFAIEKSLKNKFTGTNASGRFVLTFSEDKNRTPEITPIAVSNADKQYLALQELMTQNILVAHRVTSPMLMGIKNDTGLGSNADELNSAFEVYLNTVIKPYQTTILNCLNKILMVNGINVDLAFVQSKPMTTRFTIDDMRAVMTQEEIREELGLPPLEVEEVVDDEFDYNSQKLSQQTILEKWIENHGEILDNATDWVEVDDSEAGLDDANFEHTLNTVANTMLSKTELVRTTAPNGRVDSKSKQDGQSKQSEYQDVLYRVRYYYNRDKSIPYKSGSSSRLFCRAMMSAADRGKVYRMEELAPKSDGGIATSLSEIGANKGWGPRGNSTNYNIFKWKGGGNCHHRWYRKIYKTKVGQRMGLDDATVITTTKARSEGFKPVANPQQVPVAPAELPNRGFVSKDLIEKYG